MNIGGDGMRSLAFVGVRLAMLYLLVLAVIQWLGIFPALLSMEVPVWKVVLGAVLVFLAGPMLAMGLFMLARPISKMVVPDEAADANTLDVAGLERALFAAVGLFFAMGALVDLSWTAYFHFHFDVLQHSDDRLAQIRWEYFSHGLKLVLGLAVLLGAGGLQGLLYWLRTFGLEDK